MVVWPVVILQIVGVTAAVAGQIDSLCRERCELLVIRDGNVRLIDQWRPARDVALGKYVARAQRLVPSREAPVGDFRSPRGWRIVASVYLDHDQDDLSLHLRFFSPDGKLRAIEEALSFLEQASAGKLFGGNDDIFAITSYEEHAYNTQTEIWFLPLVGKPILLAEAPGIFTRFETDAHAVVIARETYDGVHSETKGRTEERWIWNAVTKTLMPASTRIQ